MIRDEPFSLELLQVHRQSSHGSSCNGHYYNLPIPREQVFLSCLGDLGRHQKEGLLGIALFGAFPTCSVLSPQVLGG